MAILRVQVNANDHVNGPPDAAITLVEYGDYECPYCGAAYPVVRRLRERFGSELRFVFRNFPLAQFHAHAVSAAMTAEFGAAHARFWEVHDALFENQKRLGLALYEEIVTELGLDVARLRSALGADEYLAKIRADVKSGMRSSVTGTPSFFLNGARYDGPVDFQSMAEALDEARSQREHKLAAEPFKARR